ncbi:MAG: outer membrane protein assembly factor BamD [Phycisphaerae bacterium]|nr:outer membrane protein assembly factor BamD [Phycisphaerae bacterium]
MPDLSQRKLRLAACWVSGLGLLAGTALAASDPVSPPRRERVERLQYDPQSQRWTEARPPVSGTADGDLDLIRQDMARSEFKTALAKVKKWLKTYGADHPRHAEALYLKGTAYLETGDYRGAQDTYQTLLNDYPGSEYAERSLSALFRVGEQYLAGKRRKALKGLLRIKDREGGVKIMDDMIANYADTPLAEQAQLTKANYYYERGEFDVAQEEYARFSRDFPKSRFAPKSQLYSAYSALAAFPGIKFDDAPLVEAEERFRQFMGDYPDQARQLDVPLLLDQIASTRADKTYDIARFYEKTGERQAALYYYRATTTRWPGTPAAGQARGRLTALGEPAEGAETAPEAEGQPVPRSAEPEAASRPAESAQP